MAKRAFFFYGKKIDSEWQSQKKWEKLEKALKIINFRDGNVLDIGCNNGYYLFRLLWQKEIAPQAVVGIDPVNRYFWQYLFLLKILSPSLPYLENLHYFPVGYQALPEFFKPVFSLILCMGIVYHHPNPIEIIKIVRDCLQTGGKAIFEVQGIGNLSQDFSQSSPFSLFVEKTYANKKGFWFLPTLDTLLAWLKRSGFQKIEVVESWSLTEKEQRSSKDAPFDSLDEGLNKEKIKTMEGYPLPYRHLVMATK